MIVFSILAMTALVFMSRYIFLEPRLPLTLSPKIQRLLSYSAPAVLTSLWAPIVFTDNQSLWLSSHNPYILAAIFAAIAAWKTRSIFLTTIMSMGVFLILSWGGRLW